MTTLLNIVFGAGAILVGLFLLLLILCTIADRLSPYSRGRRAAEAGKSASANPYCGKRAKPGAAEAWDQGFSDYVDEDPSR